jgi:hypothetical protein
MFWKSKKYNLFIFRLLHQFNFKIGALICTSTVCPPYRKRRKTSEKTGYMPEAAIYKPFDSGQE